MSIKMPENETEQDKTERVISALQNGNTIEDLDPIAWAVKNNVKISVNKDGTEEKIDPIDWAVKNNVKISVNKDGTEEKIDPIVWAKENNVKISFNDYGTEKKIDPIDWAVKNNVKISVNKDGTEEKIDPIVWAKENNKKINSHDPILYALLAMKEIEGKEPMTWAAQNDKVVLFNVRGIEQKMPAILMARWARRNIDRLDPIAWATLNDRKIYGQNPIAWAMNNNVTTIATFGTRFREVNIKTWIDENREAIKQISGNQKFLERYDLEKEIQKKPLINDLLSDIDKNLSKEETLDILAIKLARLARTESPITEATKAGLDFIEEKRRPEGGYLLSKESETYKNIMGQSSDYIALKIREARAKGTSSDLEEFNLNAVIRNSPADLAEKILRIAEKVNEQERNPSSTRKTIFAKFQNFCKGITSQNFNDQKLTKVFDRFKEVSRGSNLEETKQDIEINDNANIDNANIRKTLEYAQEVMRRKINNKVVGQIYKNQKGQSSGHSRQ